MDARVPQAVPPLSEMRQLNLSNALLGDLAELDAAWKRDGYWFFRGVLDTDAIARYRGVFVDLLASLGVIDRDDVQVRYNGNSLERLPPRMEPLVERKAWKLLVREPKIHDFFKRLLGDEPFWIPTVEYRATPPAKDRVRHRFDFVHQDAFYNQGIPFRICWIPLSNIDEEVGGIVVAEGLHQGPVLHDLSNPPLFPVPEGAVPGGAWRRSNYQPGDLLMMDLNLPHTGLANYSNRFRLSMDIRVMPASGDVPLIGQLTAIDSSSVSAQGDDGRIATFVIDEHTYCRGLDGKKVPLVEIPTKFNVGDDVIIASRQGRATVVRPQH